MGRRGGRNQEGEELQAGRSSPSTQLFDSLCATQTWAEKGLTPTEDVKKYLYFCPSQVDRLPEI